MSFQYNLMRAVTAVMAFTLFIVVWLMPAVAYAEAAEAADMNAASDMMMMVLKIVMTVLGILATWLTTKGIKFVEHKTKIDIPEKYETLMHSWADKGIGLAHEKSHHLVQKTGERLKGSEKMEVALGFINGMIKQYELPEMANEKLEEYIHAKLGMGRPQPEGEETTEA